jgi:hypothetical protein
MGTGYVEGCRQKAAQQMRDLASGVEAGSSMPTMKLGGGN